MFGLGPHRAERGLRGLGLAFLFAIGVASGFGSAGESAAWTSALISAVRLQDLPVQAQATEELIRQGGPFAHAKDGSVFGNRERLLPPRARGFYREYTVSTPGARDRGARRIVCGGHPPERPEACYYTDDHYANFRLIVK